VEGLDSALTVVSESLSLHCSAWQISCERVHLWPLKLQMPMDQTRGSVIIIAAELGGG
jgi:hypothetical protein